ncbi:uncharacterized protein TNCV_4608661 [Trichonephila clavipes]|nr:uncharacterized protein TNCV_4608661 [Trichonephila clavipes]
MQKTSTGMRALKCAESAFKVLTQTWLQFRRYPSRRPPDVNVIRRLDDRLRNTGSVWPIATPHDAGILRSGLTVAQADAILHLVEETPELSTCALARGMTSSKSTVHRLLRSESTLPASDGFQNSYSVRFRYTAWIAFDFRLSEQSHIRTVPTPIDSDKRRSTVHTNG